MKRHEVVVTGVGMVTPLGATASETAAAWREERSAEWGSLPELAGTPLEDAPAARLPEFNAAERLGGRRMLKYMSNASMLGCVAAREALRQAGVKERFPLERVGLFAGVGLAAASVDEVHELVAESIGDDGRFSCRRLGERGLAATNPLISFKILANMPPCLISITEGIKGPNLIFTPWEGQTAAAIQEAWLAVASGEVECAVAGAADTAAHPSTFVYLRQAGYLREDERPASGAAYLVLERGDTAARDRMRVHAGIRSIRLTPSNGRIIDPLAESMGRTFAAAPAILCGLSCLTREEEVSMVGVDGQKIELELAP